MDFLVLFPFSLYLHENHNNNHKNNIIMAQKKTSKTLSAEELYDMACDLYDKEDYVQAISLFEQAGEKGYAPAYTRIGALFLCGEGISKDHVKALDFYHRAAEAGDADAMEFLGKWYWWGSNTSEDWKKSAYYSEHAAMLGNKEAMYDMGIKYQIGVGVHQDIERSIYWHKKALENGNMNSALDLGTIYKEKKDYRLALDFYEEGIKGANPFAMCAAAQMYQEGEGNKKDIERACLLYQEAYGMFQTKAMEGDDVAQYMLGCFYFHGCPPIDIIIDYSKAFSWFEKSAQQGNYKASASLGLYYVLGLKGEQNQEKAFYWFSKAAEGNDVLGLYYMGLFFYNGICVEKDYSKAADYIEKAANMGDSAAQILLGDMHQQGIGVEQNYTKAVYWYHKAYENDDDVLVYSKLAKCYMQGLGVKKDERKAIILYTQGIDENDLESKIALAQWYYENAQKYDDKDKYNLSYKLLYLVCQEEENFRNWDTTIRFIRNRMYTVFSDNNQALYARAYFLLAKLYYTGRGVEKDPNEAIRLLNMADRYGYKDPDNPEMTAKAAIEQIIKEEEEATIADTIRSYVEVRDERTRHGERYAIILHHADGRESELNIKGRNKLVYLLALMTTLRNDTKLRARLLTYHSKALLELVEDVNISTGNKSYKDWLNECSYQKSPKDKDRYDFKDGELISYVYDPRNYTLTKKKINTKIEKVCSENERQIFGIESKGNKEKSYMYLKCAPEQVHLPDSLQDFVNDLPSDDKVLKRNPIHEIKMPYYGE